MAKLERLITPSGVKTISENGEYEIASYESVDVDVEGKVEIPQVSNLSLSEFGVLSFDEPDMSELSDYEPTCSYVVVVNGVELETQTNIIDLFNYLVEGANDISVIVKAKLKSLNGASETFQYSKPIYTNIADFTLETTTIGGVSGYKITAYNGSNAEINIPEKNTDGLPILELNSLNVSKITGLHIKKINSFKENGTIVEVNFPNTSGNTNMNYMFQYCSNLTSISQLDTSNVTTMNDMFGYCSNLTTIPQFDTSKVTYMSNMFSGCSKLINIPQLDTSKVTNMNYMFNNCYDLTTISLLDMRSAKYVDGIFTNCSKLTNLTLKNIKKNLRIGSGTSYGHLLTLESLLNTCQECINTGSSLTLTMGTANLEKLASVYVKLTNAPEEDETLPKLPMVQCESGDEGTMSVTDYMAMKNWTLA